MHGGSVLDSVDALVVNALDELGLVNELVLLDVLGELNVLVLLRPLRLLVLLVLPSPVGLLNRLEPRGRIGPLRLFELFNPLGLPRLDRPTVGVGFENSGVTLGLRELPTDEVPTDDAPADNVGEQLTPGVIVEPVAVVGALPVVPLLPVLPVVPAPPVVCANAVEALKTIAHAIPAFRILIKTFLLPAINAVRRINAGIIPIQPRA